MTGNTTHKRIVRVVDTSPKQEGNSRNAAAPALSTEDNAPAKLIDPHRLLAYHELQEWQRDTPLILSGYRPQSGSYAQSAASLFYLHNETINVYTHGLGALFFLILGVVIYFALEDKYTTTRNGDIGAFGCFFLGALLCLPMSSTFHLIMNHSPEVNRFGNKLDYLGIVCLIAGSFASNVYYGFYCDPVLQNLYWTMVSKSIGQTSVLTYAVRWGLLDSVAQFFVYVTSSKGLNGGPSALVCLWAWDCPVSCLSSMAATSTESWSSTTA